MRTKTDIFNIEKNLTIKHMNYLEDLIKKCLCDSEYKQLEKDIWTAIDNKDVKNLRRLRFDIEQTIDDINLDN